MAVMFDNISVIRTYTDFAFYLTCLPTIVAAIVPRSAEIRLYTPSFVLGTFKPIVTITVCTGGTGAAGAVAAGGAAGAGAAGGAAGAGAAGGAAGARATGGSASAGAAGGATGAGAAGGAAGTGAPGGAASARATGGAAGAGATGGAAGAGAAGVTAGAGAAGGAGGAGALGGAAGAGAAGANGGGTGAVSAVSGGAARSRPYYVSLLQEVLGLPPSPGPTLPGLTERREPESRPVSPVSCAASRVHTSRAGRVLRPRPPLVPGTHSMTLHPSTAPQRVPLPSPPAFSLPDGPDPECDSLRAASPTVTRFLATAVTDPLFESTTAFALVAELVDFAAACRLDYATSLVAESASASVCPPPIGGECALGTDVLEDRQEDFECFAAAAAMDAEMSSWKSTGTYVDEFPPPGANIVSGMWIFRATAAAPAAMANPNAEGRAVDFEVWVDDLQLFLQCDSKDGLSLFDLMSGASTAPAADADSTVRSQWTTCDAAAHFAVHSHLPSTERTHFSQYKSAKTLYDAVVALYSSPATAALVIVTIGLNVPKTKD
ncbi:unnamed protein product [Closterium sp. NIES-53]